MSERWKHQIKIGGLWTVVLVFAMSIFDLWNYGWADTFISYKFVIRLVVMLSIGIFLVGYQSWKSKNKSNI